MKKIKNNIYNDSQMEFFAHISPPGRDKPAAVQRPGVESDIGQTIGRAWYYDSGPGEEILPSPTV